MRVQILEIVIAGAMCAISLPARAVDPAPPPPAVPAVDEPVGLQGSVSLNVNASAAQTTPGNPSAGSSGGGVSGTLQTSDAWAIDLSAGLSRTRATPAAAGDAFPTSGGSVVTITGGPSWTPNDNWTLNADLMISPKATTLANTTVTIDTSGKSAPLDAQLRSVNSSWGIILGGSYETSGESAFEHGGSVVPALNHYATKDEIAAFAGGKNADLPATYKAKCSGPVAAKTAACKRLASVSTPQDVVINQFSLNASYTAMLYQRTDVSLGATAYAYDRDPTEIGYFSLATSGKESKKKADTGNSQRAAEFSFGSGAPLQPLRYSASAGVSHAFGEESRLKLALNAGYGHYYDGSGYNTNLSIKASYKFTSHWRASLVVSGNSDVQTDNGVDTPAKSGAVSATVKYTF